MTSSVSIRDSYNSQGIIAITGLPQRVTVLVSGSCSKCSGRHVISSRISEIENVFSNTRCPSLPIESYNILYKNSIEDFTFQGQSSRLQRSPRFLMYGF